MELRHLQSFVTVAEELNFRRAAERLRMSQPPLSQQIKRLEHEVGVALLRRTTRQVALTAAGEAFLTEARRALRAVQEAPLAACRAASGQTGVVRLGFSGPTSHEVLILMTRKFREHRPRVRLEIHGPVYGGELVTRLTDDEIDAGLMRLPVAGTGIQARELTRHGIVVALPAGHRLATRAEIGMDDIQDEPVVSHPTNRGAGIVALIHSAYLAHGSSPRIVQEAPDTHTILTLVGAACGHRLRTVLRQPPQGPRRGPHPGPRHPAAAAGPGVARGRPEPGAARADRSAGRDRGGLCAGGGGHVTRRAAGGQRRWRTWSSGAPAG